jgi:hypothetical protein
MKVLVTATKYGATGEIGRAIGDVLTERGLERRSCIEPRTTVLTGSDGN